MIKVHAKKYVEPVALTNVHHHVNGVDEYECQHVQCRARRLVSSSVEDLQSSLSSYTKAEDVSLLEIALHIVERRKEKTKARLLSARIKKITSPL